MNIGQMMRQVQEMQAKMADMQQVLSGITVTGTAGGGMVVIEMNGKAEMLKCSVDPKLLENPDEKEMLEDLIVAAANDAKSKAEAAIAKETEKMMGGIQLPPGMKLPM